MTPRQVNYNERSWAIDLIGHIKNAANKNNRPIKNAGGEQTITTDSGFLYPDVLLFGDKSAALILQGWELKMPDTPIDDPDFHQNAEDKARALGLDSFLLWNVTHARLYIKDSVRDSFLLSNSWDELEDVKLRNSVISNRSRWEKQADEIVAYVNHLLETKSLEGRPFVEAYRSGGVTSLIMENQSVLKDALIHESDRNHVFRAEADLWWSKHDKEYSGTDQMTVLGQAVISNWIGKILFAHILRETDSRARKAGDISAETTPSQALRLFEGLSHECNFWTIFSTSLGLNVLPNALWNQLKQFNNLLTDLRVGSVEQEQLSQILEATAEVATRKLRGQFPTPIELARLLVHLCLRNRLKDRILDPCCGSGTIVRAATEQKLAAGVDSVEVAASIFAGDLDPQAVQIATFALAKPHLMNIPMRLFQRDAFEIRPDTVIDLVDPKDGSTFSETLGEFESIATNLPFVSQSGRKQYGNAIANVNEVFGADADMGLSGRADVAAYLPFSFHPMLKQGGRLGFIITNAWLGTEWGDDFFNLLNRYFNLKCVITSGAGRWFQKTKVVANILIMEKRNSNSEPRESIDFVVLKRPLNEFVEEEEVRSMAAQIELGQALEDAMTIRRVSMPDMIRFRKYGLGGNAQFVICDWILNLPLVPISNFFSIRRGERRGKNALFYPSGSHGIEADYIRPLAKNLKDFKFLKGTAERDAFCCDRTEEELRELGHDGALNWINKFKDSDTVTRLSRSNLKWYEMSVDDMAELVMSINYDKRLFVARLDPPAFADQRLVCLDGKNNVDIDLCQALLNSTIGMFILEGMGFGRGEGALDLNKDRIEQYLHILDPSSLSHRQSLEVKDAFNPLLNREVLIVDDELEQEDRQLFDDVVIRNFGLSVSRERIYKDLRTLLGIRLSVNILA